MRAKRIVPQRPAIPRDPPPWRGALPVPVQELSRQVQTQAAMADDRVFTPPTVRAAVKKEQPPQAVADVSSLSTSPSAGAVRSSRITTETPMQRLYRQSRYRLANLAKHVRWSSDLDRPTLDTDMKCVVDEGMMCVRLVSRTGRYLRLRVRATITFWMLRKGMGVFVESIEVVRGGGKDVDVVGESLQDDEAKEVSESVAAVQQAMDATWNTIMSNVLSSLDPG